MDPIYKVYLYVNDKIQLFGNLSVKQVEEVKREILELTYSDDIDFDDYKVDDEYIHLYNADLCTMQNMNVEENTRIRIRVSSLGDLSCKIELVFINTK